MDVISKGRASSITLFQECDMSLSSDFTAPEKFRVSIVY